MLTSARVSLLCFFGFLAGSQTACNMVPHEALRQSQLAALRLHHQNKAIAAERDVLHAEKQQLASSLEIASRRLENLAAERSKLQERYVSLLQRAQNGPNPLSPGAIRRFEELAKKYPEFEFDPNTGVSKFHSDILFSSGSADLKSTAHPILTEFASIMNQSDARALNILVVGHTDDKPIVKNATKSKHETNWHLSTNRANSVALALSKHGLKQSRMGVAGYSMFQPLVSNTDEKSRQRNRRVEIFVLAPDASVAGWEPGPYRN